MELKTLWLGLLVSCGTFAVKTGLGWAYAASAGRARRRVLASLAVILSYAGLFALVWLVVAKINLLAHYETLLPLWRQGFLLHWLTAAMLLIWGVFLLRRPAGQGCHSNSRGWLALVIPCPVCLSLILMSAATLNLYFPEQALGATAALFLAFMAIAALAAALARPGAGRPGAGLEADLGLAMMLVALYFILSALLFPQFTEVRRVYRLTAYAAEGQTVNRLAQAATLGITFALLAAGFFRASSGLKAGRPSDCFKSTAGLPENNAQAAGRIIDLNL